MTNCTVETYLNLSGYCLDNPNDIGGVHKLREQGRGRGVVLKMFTLVHKGEEGGSANVHVGLNCKYFK